MKTVATVATGSLIVASVAQAQVVQWDIEKRASPDQRIRKRGSTVTESVQNELNYGGYFATVKIGTPSQKLTLQLDTGSSDIWVPASSASVCSSSGGSSSSSSSTGCALGSFDYQSSTSFDDIGRGLFDIAYVDGSGSKGDYFTDVFVIGGANLTNMTMGLGLATDIPYGLVGVGYALDEAYVSKDGSESSAYPNLPVQMKDEGLIKTEAYSLWLNDLGASTGNILFGGIDTNKYEGDLSRIDVIKDSQSNAYTSFTVYMTSLTASSSSGSDNLSSAQFPIPVVLDSGTSLSYVPFELAKQVWNEVGAVYSADVGTAVIPCSMANSKGTFVFGFAGDNGPKISVGMDELVLSIGDATFSSGKYAGETACEFGIQNSTSTYLLGDTFLRSAYVVYDLANNQIGIAKTDFNATSSNVVAFPSDGAQIPSATSVANQVTAYAMTGSATTPAYGASSGFADGVSNMGNIVPAFDWTQLSVMGATVVFIIVGSGFLPL